MLTGWQPAALWVTTRSKQGYLHKYGFVKDKVGEQENKRVKVSVRKT